ncbi:PD-(D/E)XK nuclease family protein [Candidatus Woesearchaeota archaeon]|nr:PD-(D/E)XK nuclease family protein [Candidatus Woesearchaeota archaeon]
MAKRLQSPSSINTYKQCPRKYFYQYKLKYPTKENIHTVRGGIVHEALEKFYTADLSSISPDTYKQSLSSHLKNLFDKYWRAGSTRLHKLGLSDDQLTFYYTESVQMLANWISHLFNDIDKELAKNIAFPVAFRKLAPIAMEKEYRDSELMVRGFIDVIHQDDQDIILMDYKTSKSDEFKPEYMLQLGIYAVLYEKQHGKYPTKVGLWLLKHKPVTIKVTPELVKNALFEIEQIHFATDSDTISDYPKKVSPLCKYSTGQCDFYDICQRDR